MSNYPRWNGKIEIDGFPPAPSQGRHLLDILIRGAFLFAVVLVSLKLTEM